MARRFSDLEKQAVAILANGGNPANSQDEALRNYWQWKINPSSAAHRLPSTSKRPQGRKTDAVFLEPFAIDLPTGIVAKVTISRRSGTAATQPIRAACGLISVTNQQAGIGLKGYTPARVYWRTGAAETSSDRISRITNQPYKSFYAGTDEGFSVPFGRNGTDSLAQRQQAIKNAIAPQGSPIQLITFSPEKYRGAGN